MRRVYVCNGLGQLEEMGWPQLLSFLKLECEVFDLLFSAGDLSCQFGEYRKNSTQYFRHPGLESFNLFFILVLSSI